MTKTQARDWIVQTVVEYLREGGDVGALVGQDPKHHAELWEALVVLSPTGAIEVMKQGGYQWD